VGLGRLDPHALPAHVSHFLQFLKCAGKIAFDLPGPMLGPADQLYERARRNIVGDGILLVGDAAGMAYAQSGEGIRPAVESGLLAAKAIRAASGRYDRDSLSAYPRLLASRFGNAEDGWASAVGRRLPDGLIRSAAKLVMASRWFSRHIVLDRWFLHRHQPALSF
jgi:flavin-dependent dehydrogenase